MKKKIAMLIMIILASITLMGCGKFECSLCGKEKSGKKYQTEYQGSKITICQDCYDELKGVRNNETAAQNTTEAIIISTETSTEATTEALNNNASWDISDDMKVLTFHGDGYCACSDDCSAYADYVEKIIFEEGITTIHLRGYFVNITEIEFPSSLKKIKENCFNNSVKLERIVLPENLLEIHGSAFFGCKSLKEVVFNEKLSILGDFAFASTSLSGQIILPDSIEEVGSSVFTYTNVTSIYIPEGVTRILSNFNNVYPRTCDVVYGGSLKEWIGLGMEDGGDGWTITYER